MMEKQTQLALFAQAVAALGGQRATARALRVTDRTIRDILSGERTLHARFLADVAAALLARADTCRALERRLNPLFAANRAPGQDKLPPRAGNRNAAKEHRA